MVNGVPQPLAACNPLGFGHGTSLGTPFSMINPWLFQTLPHHHHDYHHYHHHNHHQRHYYHREGGPIDLVIYVLTNKQMLVGVGVDSLAWYNGLGGPTILTTQLTPHPRYRVAGLMVDGEEEERVKQEQPNIFPLVPLEEIKKIKKKIKRETKVESRMEDTPVQSDVLTEVDVMEQEEDEEEEEQDAKEEEEEAEEEDQEEVDEADVLCKGEIVPEMNITMDADAEDVADDEDDEEEETEEMPESDVSNLFINGEEGEEDEEEEGAGDIVSADTLDDMMSYDEDVNDEENEQKEEDEEEGEEEEENDDDEEEEGEEEDDEEDPRDPDYEIEEDEEEDHVTLGETLKEETKVEPSEVFSEAITKVLIKSENENVNDLYKGTPVLSIQKKRKGCRPSTLMKVKLARSLY